MIEFVENSEDAEIVIIGVPFDEGIAAIGGRLGAKQGPSAVRKAIANLDCDDFIGLKIFDFGDVEVVDGDIVATHQNVTDTVSGLIKKGIFPIVIGGGHDISFANVRSLAENSKGKVGGINIDAHFDVRPVDDKGITSGTPFWRALEELNGKVDGERFVEIGSYGDVNSKEHHQYLVGKGSTIVTLDKLREAGVEKVMRDSLDVVGDSAFFSIDIDSVSGKLAPGCSAPAKEGLTVDEILNIAIIAGKADNIKLFDLMEVSPPNDVDNQTSDLAASIIYNFLKGYLSK